VILEENEPIALKHIIRDDIEWKIPKNNSMLMPVPNSE
jgi:hypothetical protein